MVVGITAPFDVSPSSSHFQHDSHQTNATCSLTIQRRPEPGNFFGEPRGGQASVLIYPGVSTTIISWFAKGSAASKQPSVSPPGVWPPTHRSLITEPRADTRRDRSSDAGTMGSLSMGALDTSTTILSAPGGALRWSGRTLHSPTLAKGGRGCDTRE